MLHPLSSGYRVLRCKCVSLYPLYGGRKDQRRNFIRVPQGSIGEVTHECVSDAGVVYLRVKFPLKRRLIHVKCAPAMVQLEPVDSGPAVP